MVVVLKISFQSYVVGSCISLGFLIGIIVVAAINVTLYEEYTRKGSKTLA